jgi:electron transfer flavoprotein alpha subunit
MSVIRNETMSIQAMSILVVVDHDNAAINASTLHTLGAATQITGDIDLLVMGHQCDEVINAAMAIPNVRQVLSVQSATLENPVAENMAAIVVKQAADYSHILASSSSFGKNMLPRVAALLDVVQVSDISAVIDAKTFERPIYAGNVLATVRCKKSTK